MGNGGRAGQQRRSRVADLLTNISPAYAGEMGIMNTRKLCLFVLLALLLTACGKSSPTAVTTEPEQAVTRGIPKQQPYCKRIPPTMRYHGMALAEYINWHRMQPEDSYTNWDPSMIFYECK